MVDIYADCGVTGTSVQKRDDFQRLITDCRKGYIDRVLCKSISRFARNAKECLEIIRELKSLGIGVCFEKEGINTATVSGEMLTAIFASIAQSESESIAGNIRWSYQKRMESGEFNTCKYPFGYRLTDGKLEVFEPEAQIVREIFHRFLFGQNSYEIAEYVNTLGIPTRDGREQWQLSTIRYILQNERYVGEARLQKFYSTETLPYRKKRNHGERPQYLVKNSNPPIVAPETFEAAARLIQQRKENFSSINRGGKPLSKKLRCGCCGVLFREKASGTKKYWVCLTHSRDRRLCELTQIPESEVYTAFFRLYYKLKHQGAEVLPQMLASLQAIRNQRMLWNPYNSP